MWGVALLTLTAACADEVVVTTTSRASAALEIKLSVSESESIARACVRLALAFSAVCAASSSRGRSARKASRAGIMSMRPASMAGSRRSKIEALLRPAPLIELAQQPAAVLLKLVEQLLDGGF